MKIESLLRRPGGTKVTLEGVEYHFKPGPDGREFADVTNVDHVGVFASIREGYRVAGMETKAPEPVPFPPANPAPAAPAPVQSGPYVDSAADPAHDEAYEKMTRHELASLFFKAFGRHPAPRLSTEKIIEALRDA